MKLHRWANIKNRGMTAGRIARSDARVARDALAINLEEVRKQAGLTQQELGARAAFSQSQLSRLERSGNATLGTLIRYTSAAGASLEISATLNGKRVLLLSAKAEDAGAVRKHEPRVRTKHDARVGHKRFA